MAGKIKIGLKWESFTRIDVSGVSILTNLSTDDLYQGLQIILKLRNRFSKGVNEPTLSKRAFTLKFPTSEVKYPRGCLGETKGRRGFFP